MPTSALSVARVALAAGTAVTLTLVCLPAPSASESFLLAHAERNGLTPRKPAFELNPAGLPPSVPSQLETLIASARRPAKTTPAATLADSGPGATPFFEDGPAPAGFDAIAFPAHAGPAPLGRSFPLTRVASLGAGAALSRPAPSVPLEDESFFPIVPEPIAAAMSPTSEPPPAADPDPGPWLDELRALRESVERIGDTQARRARELERMRSEILAVGLEAVRLAATPRPAVFGPTSSPFDPAFDQPEPLFPREWVVEVLPRILDFERDASAVRRHTFPDAAGVSAFRDEPRAERSAPPDADRLPPFPVFDGEDFR